jgi:subtilase family serine protease
MPIHRNSKRNPVICIDSAPIFVEQLESRQMLSAAVASATVHYDSKILKYAANAAAIQGFSPAEIRHSYGFDRVSLANGAVAGTGQGQTIAIVDAYNDPNIVNDLAVFDAQFGLSAPPSFSIVNQSGGSALPSVDTGWAGEISLDVEWAHAIAPQANIVLVEANSSSVSDLMAGVNLARNLPAVSTVSMSWGGSEFETFGGAEFSSQTDYDPFFTTPAGHQGVTFVASAGDTGVRAGAQWPSTSPNVLSVGGTSLYTADSIGSYSSEGSWSGTSGGFSLYEGMPTYQNVAAAGAGVRVTPDVTYDGDPNTGFAVYDSLPDQGYSGWQEVGGTSAGAPQWAALVAIANQSRAIAGKATLDGPTGTLPALYSAYGAPGTAGYTNYTSYFNDIVDFGRRRNGASEGYDILSGLGSPHAPSIVSLLTDASTGTGGASGATVALPPSPISGAILTSPPASVVAGARGSAKILLTNTSDNSFSGPVTVTMYVSSTPTLDASATAVTTLTISKLGLRAGSSRTQTLRFAYPKGLPAGQYYLIAQTSATGTNTTPDDALAATGVFISPPTVDLAASFSGQAVSVFPGRNGTANLTIQNLGNVTATGTFSLALYASLDGVVDPSDVLLATSILKKISIAPGRSITLHIRFKAPANLAAGSYNLIAATYGVSQPADGNTANNIAVTPTA